MINPVTGVINLALTPSGTYTINYDITATPTNCTISGNSSFTITITDVIGNTVMSICDKMFDAGKNSVSISTEKLSSGIYFCVMNVNGNIVAKKLFKN